MFKYKVEDNFFDNEDLTKLQLIANDEKNFRDLNDNNSIVINFEDQLNSYLIKKYEPKLIKSLKDLNPRKNKLHDYSEISITIAGKNHEYPIHNDSLTKILSTVVYLHPENNIGTTIYDEKKKNPKEIEWKINRAFTFSRRDKGTWHSYKSDGKSCRSAVIFTLRTKKLNRALIFDRGIFFFCIKKIKDLFFL